MIAGAVALRAEFVSCLSFYYVGAVQWLSHRILINVKFLNIPTLTN